MKQLTIDRRDCPDWMHIRQFVYLEQTAPRVLARVLHPHRRSEATNRTGRPVNPAGMIRHAFRQSWPANGRCCPLCGVQLVRGEEVAYWGTGDFGHALCRIAEWTRTQDERSARRKVDAAHSRRRRAANRKVPA